MTIENLFFDTTYKSCIIIGEKGCDNYEICRLIILDGQGLAPKSDFNSVELMKNQQWIIY